MNIVIVKHENCGQKYLFEVPRGNSVRAGDLVKVRNKRGEALATCLCDSFTLDEGSNEYEAICSAFGATRPLAQIIGRFFYSAFEQARGECEVYDNFV